jgi:endonuclease G
MAISTSLFRRLVEENNHVFRDPNVLSIGIGHKVRDGEKTGQLALIIAVRKKVRREKAIPQGYLVPKRVKVGPKSQKSPRRHLATDVIERKPKHFSAGPGNLIGAAVKVSGGSSSGTLGGFLRDQFGGYYALSCAHVLTDFGRITALGLPVELSANGRRIGVLTRHSPLRPGLPNPVDVALARVTAPDLQTALANSQPMVPGIGSLNIGEPATIIGAVSGRSTGVVRRVEVQERVFGWGGLPSEYCLMIRQIEVEALGAGGDSGALSFNQKGRAAGLFIADNGNFDLVTPIQRALAFAAEPSAMNRAANDTSVLELSFV